MYRRGEKLSYWLEQKSNSPSRKTLLRKSRHHFCCLTYHEKIGAFFYLLDEKIRITKCMICFEKPLKTSKIQKVLSIISSVASEKTTTIPLFGKCLQIVKPGKLPASRAKLCIPFNMGLDNSTTNELFETYHGQALDMFSQIFLIRIYEFFLPFTWYLFWISQVLKTEKKCLSWQIRNLFPFSSDKYWWKNV